MTDAPPQQGPDERARDREREDRLRRHREVSETLNRTMLALPTFALFCRLTALGSPDRLLVVVGAATLAVAGGCAARGWLRPGVYRNPRQERPAVLPVLRTGACRDRPALMTSFSAPDKEGGLGRKYCPGGME
jgi:hypothetical protein